MLRVSSLRLSLLLSLFALPSYALDTVTRPIGPVRTWDASEMADFSSAWLQVKFVEESDVTLQDGRFVDPSGLDLSGLQRVLGREAILGIRPMLLVDRLTARAWKRAGEERSGVTGPDLSLWFDLQIAGGRTAVARLANALNALSCVEIAGPMPIPQMLGAAQTNGGSGGSVSPSTSARPAPATTPDFTQLQGYLYDPPSGFDAPAAWAYAGGLGTGGKIIDLEFFASRPDHEDFDPSKSFYFGGVNHSASNHELAALGEVIGQHNSFGVNGLAPDVLYGVQDGTGSYDDIAQDSQAAIDQLGSGDAWFVELGLGDYPLEWWQACYDVIWTGVWARGISCIEASANGGLNLDDPSFNRIFDRTFRDSGAILCAAGTPTTLLPDGGTNYGSRIDLNGWGSQIVTAGYGDLYDGGSPQTRYTAFFCCTSGATAMVAGGAMSIQGIARAGLGAPLDPIALRTILHNTGTPHQGNIEIGTRPNLRAAAQALSATGVARGPTVSSATRVRVSPNPFRVRTELSALVPQAGAARIEFFDTSGRRIRSLESPGSAAGESRWSWDGTDDAGRRLPSGVYLYRLVASGAGGGGSVQLVR